MIEQNGQPDHLDPAKRMLLDLETYMTTMAAASEKLLALLTEMQQSFILMAAMLRAMREKVGTSQEGERGITPRTPYL